MHRRTLLAAGAGVLVPGGTVLATPGIAHASTDYGPATWYPAAADNYTNASRESDYNINYVVIHTTQGSASGTLSWFRNSSSNVSAHYVIRSNDGHVWQCVRDADIAWHAGNWTYNTQAIGIEHEGFVEQDGWYTEAMYQSSAALTRHLCARYNIPKDRSHIIGHSEVPGASHTDPGWRWNWSYYMNLVNGGTPPPSWQSTVDNTTAGRFSASGNWGTSSYSSQRYGSNYRYAEPVSASDAAYYKFNIPATANYRVEAWHPALPGYNTAAPYIMFTTSGSKVVYIDQRGNGGKWRNLGTFNFAAGEGNAVAVSRWTSGTGLVIADAVRLTRV